MPPIKDNACSVRWQSRLADLIIAIALFTVIMPVYLTHPSPQSVDSMWTLHVAMSIVREGNTNLDEYQDVIQARNGYAVETIQQHLYNYFPIGTPLLSVPFVFVADQVTQRSWTVPLSEQLHAVTPTGGVLGLELLIASLIVALTSTVMYAIARLFLSRWRAIGLVLIFAFCTSARSTASRGLWQHGPSMLMLTLALYLALRAQRQPAKIQFAGLLLAYAFIVRPTNSVPFVLFTLYVFLPIANASRIVCFGQRSLLCRSSFTIGRSVMRCCRSIRCRNGSRHRHAQVLPMFFARSDDDRGGHRIA